MLWDCLPEGISLMISNNYPNDTPIQSYFELRELRLGGWVSRLGTIDDGAPLFKAVTIPGMLGELLPRAVNGRSTYRLYIQTAQMPHKYTDNHW